MTHTRTRTVTRFVCTVFAASLFSIGVRAAAPQDQTAADLKDVRDLLNDIKRRLDNQQTSTEIVLDIVRKDIKDLRDEVSKLQRELTDVRNRANNPNSTSMYNGVPSTSLSPGVPSARIRLINTHFIDMTAVINGVVVTIPPGLERTISVPAGNVNYQVLQVPEALKMRTLIPNETLTLTLFPR